MTSRYNICLLQPKGYGYTGAFYEIADLLAFALRELGHEASIRTNTIDDSGRNILIGVHLWSSENANQLPSDSIILNTEQLGGTIDFWSENITQWFSHNFTLWDYSDTNVAYLKNAEIPNVNKLQLGFQKELQRITRRPTKDVDVLFYGCLNKRRQKIISALTSKGLRVKVLQGVFGQLRDNWIARSHLVLNHHYYETEIFEVVRAFYLMTNGIPIVGEVNPTTKIDDIYRDGLLCCPYKELVSGISSALQDKKYLEELGMKGQETIQTLPQAEILRELL